MHFAEIQNLGSNEIREFNITYNGGEVWESFFRPHKLKITTIFSPTALSSSDGKFNFTFTMTESSTLPPLINALEVYTDVENLLLETHQDEVSVSAMMNIKKTYGLMNKKISWQGDPCSPKTYRWKGVKCLYLNSDQPRIISLYLAASDLNGAITPDIAGLTQLRELDLSKNDLSGELPDFLADMKLLTLINLKRNPKLNLTIPDSLQQKIDDKVLILLFMIRKGNIKNIIDPKLMGDFDTNGVWKAIELAMTCVNPTSNHRPTMPHVVMELKECLESETSRKQGSQVMCFEDSIDFNLSPGSESPPRPRYYITNLLSEKSDVYSFGIVLLEIITNQAVIDTTRERSHITNWVRFMIRKGNIKNIIDPKLMGDFDTNGVWKAIELAMTCVNPTSNHRPTMPHVVMELKECLESEISRKQGSQVMCFEDSIDFNLSPGSESPPRP
ncbi:hypothetical protein F2Q70_00042785, partial [Brassica cretica]